MIKKLISNKKYFIMFIVLIGLLSITIGSALISSTLSLTGTTKINKNTWYIHFMPETKRIAADSVETDNPAHIVDAAYTRMEWSVDLKNPGDFYEYTINIINEGTLDAYIESITKTELTEEQQEYLDFYVEYFDIDIHEPEQSKEIKPCDILRTKALHDYIEDVSRKIIVYVGYKDGIDLSKYPNSDSRLNLFFDIKYVQNNVCEPIREPTKHWLRINPNGGLYEGRTEPRDIYLEEGSTYTVLLPTLKYHNFEGWTFDVDQETSKYTYIDDVFTMGKTNVEITANWREGDYVARIMDTYFPTVQEAFDAAKETWDDNTVWLLRDVTEDPTNRFSKPFAFNLDGHTLTGQIVNNANGVITLLNGRVDAGENHTVAFENYGKLTIGENDGYVDVDNSIALVGSDAGLENFDGGEFFFL